MMSVTSTYPVGLSRSTGKNARLKSALAEVSIVMAPGCFDCLTAKLVANAGFGAGYITGSGLSMSALGAPDMGVISFGEIVERVMRICDSVDIPLICDADTGYGGPINVIRTVKDLERAGVSGIQIEDQAWPKKCGHEPGRKVVDVDEMVGRIKAAVDARDDSNLLIIARTDARTEFGIEVAIERALRYQEAGADVLFVESPESEEEMRRINQSIKAPTLANMVEGGRTPVFEASKLYELGYKLAIFPNSLTRMIAKQGAELMQTLKQNGATAAFSDRMVDHRGLWDLFDYPAWTDLERKFANQ
ncbi:isocitrate lyase/PEP mutase family protein [Orrella daihaiensis]|uniref:Oxaloacetate decarboxylase n=1 Tax=Orrella daihaiensis TaxID=2782176 RepID=A0ABY4AIV3_9BURK|nr:oxaloacetate decarboxylase [Orrella daihaiensis]UOD50003.1 oxaloacetate decarboxylase [Orrella daihaiensis]